MQIFQIGIGQVEEGRAGRRLGSNEGRSEHPIQVQELQQDR